MYVTDLTHYLDSKGAIAPGLGPAREMADFLTAAVARASDFDDLATHPARSASRVADVTGAPARSRVSGRSAGTVPFEIYRLLGGSSALLRHPDVTLRHALGSHRHETSQILSR
jgi:hypothetical protein